MKKLMQTMLAFLGISAFSEENGKKVLTEEQKKNIKESFGEELLSRVEKGLAEEDQHGAELTQLQTQLQTAQSDLDALKKDKKTTEEQLAAANSKITTLQETINKLSDEPENDPGAKGQGKKPNEKNNNMDDKFLLGVKQSYMAIDATHPYNQRAYAALMERQGVHISSPVASSFDYASLKSDLGDYYRIRKQEAIQSFIAKLPSVEQFFPLESGYQDQAVLVNIFMGEFSQADNSNSTFDNVVKGTYEFQPEVLTMYDVMFAHKFTGLKELEKTWIGYLNREGSDSMKWSFIEFILSETAKKLHNEREIRRLKGVRKNPTANVPGTALQAANGLLKFIKNKVAGFQIKEFEVGEPTVGGIANYVYAATQLIPEVWIDSGMLRLYMSTTLVSWYHKNLETLYGTNQDYKANIMFVKEYPSVQIIPVPNMGSSMRMIWTLEGNIKTFEDKPNEMLNFNLEQQDWSLKVWSQWKESIWALLVGKKYASAAEMPDDYSTQLIWVNDVDEPSTYFIPMVADDTTPSALEHTSLVSVANTVATAITAIDDTSTGDTVILKCGNATNAITIAASGNFSLLTGAWTPEVGDTLTIKKRSDGKWIELARTNATSEALVIAADDATPSVTGGTVFITSANTVASPLVEVSITNLDNAVTGVVYRIYGGSDTNSSVIYSSGNFVLTATMTLAEGTYIDLQKAENGKFYEISRG